MEEYNIIINYAVRITHTHSEGESEREKIGSCKQHQFPTEMNSLLCYPHHW